MWGGVSFRTLFSSIGLFVYFYATFSSPRPRECPRCSSASGTLPWRWDQSLGPCARSCRGSTVGRSSLPRKWESPLWAVSSLLGQLLLPLVTSFSQLSAFAYFSESLGSFCIYPEFLVVIRVEKGGCGPRPSWKSLRSHIFVYLDRSFYFRLHPRRILGRLWHPEHLHWSPPALGSYWFVLAPQFLIISPLSVLLLLL